MMRICLLLFLFLVNSYAISSEQLVGNWTAYRESTNNGTVTIEKEYLHLNANKTFTVQLLVSVENGDAFIKDLRIEASGIWKSNEDVLALYIKNLKVPFAKEIYRISQASLKKIASVFENKYKVEPLKIIHIQNVTATNLTTSNEKHFITAYKKY